MIEGGDQVLHAWRGPWISVITTGMLVSEEDPPIRRKITPSNGGDKDQRSVVESVVRRHIENWWRDGKLNCLRVPADADALVADLLRTIKP